MNNKILQAMYKKNVFLFTITALFLSLSGCKKDQTTQPTPLPPSVKEKSIMLSDSFMYDGIMRAYNVYIPGSYTPDKHAPLVLNLHGYSVNRNVHDKYADMKPIADTAGFIMVLPQGSVGLGGNVHWNARWNTGVDDIGFIHALLDTLIAKYSIDERRIYSTGMSNGGFMSLTLAGEASNRFAAVASVTGTMSIFQIPANTVNRPFPIMLIHGTADSIVRFDGNPFLSVDSVLSYWRIHNGCQNNPMITYLPDIDMSDSSTVERFEYTQCRTGGDVVFYKIIDGGHQWPGTSIPPSNLGNANQDFNAGQVIWQFFRKYTNPISI